MAQRAVAGYATSVCFGGVDLVQFRTDTGAQKASCQLAACCHPAAMKPYRRHLLRTGTVIGAPGVPLGAGAQPSPVRIGWSSFIDPVVRLEEFRVGWRALGCRGAQDLRIDAQLAARHLSGMAAAVDELLRDKVALIVAHANAAALMQRVVFGKVPVLLAFSGDRSSRAWCKAWRARGASRQACPSWRLNSLANGWRSARNRQGCEGLNVFPDAAMPQSVLLRADEVIQ